MPGGGGGGGFVDFLVILIVILLVAALGVLGYGCYKGWTYPKLTALVSRMPARSQTTPTPGFDPGMGPISSQARGAPLSSTDSATPYLPPASPN